MNTPNLTQLIRSENEYHHIVQCVHGRYSRDVFAFVIRMHTDAETSQAQALHNLLISTEDAWFDVLATIRDCPEFPMATGKDMADALTRLDERIGCMGPLTRAGWWPVAEGHIEQLLSKHP